MKLILLAALAAATPVMAPAQTTPLATTDTPPPPASTAPASMPATPTAGGYQPSTPALQGTPQPGVTPQFVAAPSPDQAFPPPAPLDHYPFCKRGQFDKCMQRHSPK